MKKLNICLKTENNLLNKITYKKLSAQHKMRTYQETHQNLKKSEGKKNEE